MGRLFSPDEMHAVCIHHHCSFILIDVTDDFIPMGFTKETREDQ